MEQIIDLIDSVDRAQVREGDSVRAWMIRQQANMTYVQRIVAMIQRTDLEHRPPPDQVRSFLFRGQAHELVSWPINGYHPQGCVWFPTKEAWIILRRSPVVPIISLAPWFPSAEHDGAPDLANIPSFEHGSRP